MEENNNKNLSYLWMIQASYYRALVWDFNFPVVYSLDFGMLIHKATKFWKQKKYFGRFSRMVWEESLCSQFVSFSMCGKEEMLAPPSVQRAASSPHSFLIPPWLLWFGRSVVSDCLWPHGLQHVRLLCLSLSPRACSNLCPWSRWCHPTVSSSVAPVSSCPQSFPASGSLVLCVKCGCALWLGAKGGPVWSHSPIRRFPFWLHWLQQSMACC